MFEPIAIIGRACLLPGAKNPQELWQLVLAGQDCLQAAPAELWRLNPKSVLAASSAKQLTDLVTTDKTGFIKQFETIFDPTGFHISADDVRQQDNLCQWLLHVAREALTDANYPLQRLTTLRAGAIIGNLSYPSNGLSEYAEAVWLLAQGPQILGKKHYQRLVEKQLNSQHRFMSGYPVHFMANGLGLAAQSYAIDAACASALYAIKLACDSLQDGRADLMLAGGINAADSLFLHMGFTALQALSKSGQSRPLHQEADGLIPAHGAGIVVLKRLQDAVKNKDPIYGVIRGIGLANDGNSRGFLIPAESGQILAMQHAYRAAEIAPDTISWIDCHATGTLLGDATEIRSMRQIFGNSEITIGALKSNIGHSITASGAAALINTLSAFEAQLKPPTRSAPAKPAQILQESSFKLLKEAEAWETSSNDLPRRAAINAFGFGGNNAHLIVEEYLPEKPLKVFVNQNTKETTEIAIVGMGVIAASAANTQQFAQALFEGKSLVSHSVSHTTAGGYVATIDLPVQTKFPPNDLKHALGQQLAILKAAQEALMSVKNFNPAKTAALIGMGCDAEIARCGLSWRLADCLPEHDPAWVKRARASIRSPLEAADVLGTMPNIVTNRLNVQYDFKAPSYSISAEELSGIVALQTAIRELSAGEIDAALVGAVDMSCEIIHQTAAKQLLGEDKQIPGDAAVVLLLKRLSDARNDQDNILAIINNSVENADSAGLKLTDSAAVTNFAGHAHAASGLLQVAIAALACQERLLPFHQSNITKPWLSPDKQRSVYLSAQALGGQQLKLAVHEYPQQQVTAARLITSKPKIYLYSGNNRAEILHALKAGNTSNQGSVKLAIVAADNNDLLNKQQLAIQQLASSIAKIDLSAGLYFREAPLTGEVAFVFTGATTSYAGMGQELWLNFPELINTLADEVQSLSEIFLLMDKLAAKQRLTMFEELKTYSFLAQMHALFTQNILQLKPAACIGYCSGETNALIAMRAWRDMEQLFFDVGNSQIYTETLCGKFSVLNNDWMPVDGQQSPWVGWRVFADVAAVKQVIATIPQVRLTIINSSHDCIIAGHPQACDQALKLLDSPKASCLPYSMVIHCPEFQPMSDLWWKLHYRQTYPVPGVRFYSAGSGVSYQVNAETAAQALLSQASQTVDFPRVINQAWQDGVRIFIEHGPRSLCSQWIKDILADKEHLMLTLDAFNIGSMPQLAQITAQLLVAGVNCDYQAFRP